MICLECPSNYIIEDAEGNRICHMCGKFVYQIIQHPILLDLISSTTKKRQLIEVRCIICNHKFKTTSRGKNTKTTCSEECMKIKKDRYIKSKQSENSNRICKKCAHTFISKKKIVYCPECYLSMSLSKVGRPRKVQAQITI